jgi:hypothetical protein
MLGDRTFRKGFAKIGVLGLLALFSFGLASCNSSSNSTGMGSANVTMSDPPSNTDYGNVWVTVDGVEASVSTSDTGWVPLVSSLSSTSGSIKAVQLDLMNLPANGKCLLAQLGSTQSLPAGDYQQIRLILVPNNATGVTLLSPSSETTTNQCASVSAWNCAMPSGGTLTALQLSSQAQTGLKIPPGQILGGPISVASGKSVDINIDFNADRSIVNQAGQLRLNPVLVAYQASQNLTGISGQVVEGTMGTSGVTATSTAIANANVALEMANGNPMDGSNNVDLIGNYLVQADSNGNFDFCPLPAGPFDVVASAGPVTDGTTSTTTTYGATVVTGVPNGTQVSVPLLSQTTGASTLTGNLKSSAATSATSVTADLYALQTAGSSLEFAVPLLTGSNPAIAQLGLTCSGGSCSSPYSLILPPSNPLIGSFSAGSISWTTPAAAPFTYNIEGTCTGSSGTLSVFSSSQTVTGGNSTSVPDLTLGTCQ